MADEYFIDFNRGNDSNAGTSPSAPWKTLFKMDDAAKGPGDRILLADDSQWDIGHAATTRVNPGTNWTGTRENPVVIGKYSPSSQSVGQYPIITNYYVTQAGDWTYSAPNNAWVFASLTTYAWQRSVLCRINGTWDAELYDLGELTLPSEDYAFNVDNANFYIYAPSDTNPVDYYGTILVSGGGSVFHFQAGRNWITVEDLEFRDTSTGILVNVNGTGALGVRTRNIRGRTVSGLIRVTSTGAAAGGLAEIDIGHSNVSDFGMSVIYPVCTHGVARLDIHHNRLSDGIHSEAQGAIYTTAAIENGRTRIFGNVIDKIRFGTKYQVSDGCGIYADIGADKVDVYNNIVFDAYLPANDNGGKTTRWWGNVFYNVHTGFRLGDGQADVGTPNTDHDFFNNTIITGNGSSWKSPYSPGLPQAGWRCSETTNTIPTVVVRNNLMMDVTGASPNAGIMAPRFVTLETYENNAISGYSAVATRNISPFTAVSTTDTLTGDPMVLPDGRPLPGSPLLTGGVDLGLRRGINGVLGRRFIGAYPAAQLLNVY